MTSEQLNSIKAPIEHSYQSTLDPEFQHPDGHPKKCSNCGCTEFNIITKDRIENIVCEEEYRCEQCNKIVAYWAYGWFDPDFMIHKNPQA